MVILFENDIDLDNLFLFFNLVVDCMFFNLLFFIDIRLRGLFLVVGVIL